MPPERLTMYYCEDVNCTKYGEETNRGKCLGDLIVLDEKYDYRDLLEILRERRRLLDRQIDDIVDKL